MRRIPITQFRVIYSEILNRVAFNHETVRIEKHGKPLAVVVPVDEYNELKLSKRNARLAKKAKNDPQFSS
jgi:prevent-host-death family protein